MTMTVEKPSVIKVKKNFGQIVQELAKKEKLPLSTFFEKYGIDKKHYNRLANAMRSKTQPPIITILAFQGLLSQYLINKYVMLRASLIEPDDEEYEMICDMEMCPIWVKEYRELKRIDREKMIRKIELENEFFKKKSKLNNF